MWKLLTVCPVGFRPCQIAITTTNEWAYQETGLQSWTPLPGAFSCVHPGMTVLSPTTAEKGFQMPNTNRHLPSAPLSCVQASLCTSSQMLNKDHDTTTAIHNSFVQCWLIMSTYAKKQKTKKNISQLKGATSCSATQNMADIQEYYWANSVFVFFRQKTQCSLGWGWLISNNSYTPLEMPKLISSNYSWITDLQLYVLFSSVQGACQWGLKKIQLFDSPLACLTKVWLWRMPSAPGKHQIVNW